MRLTHTRNSLRQRLSWWLALQSFAGLGAVCIVVYLVAASSFRERQNDALVQKEMVVRHLLTASKEHRDPEILAHRLDDFLIGHEDLQLEISEVGGRLIYPLTPNKKMPDRFRQKIFEITRATDTAVTALKVNISLDIQADEKLLHRLALTLFLAAISGAIVVSLGGLSLVSLGLRPVRQLADQTRKVTTDRLDHRLDGEGQPSELIPLVEQFNALLARIEQAYTQLEGFNADVAHELCTPLAILIANNELALRNPEDEDVNEVLASNLEELHRLTGIVNDMLFVSQADRGVSARRTSTPSLAGVVAEVVDYHEAVLSEAGLQVEIVGDAEGAFDVPLLRRAISNLLGNATRHAIRDTTVKVSIKRLESGLVSLRVVNFGVPVDPVCLPRLFDRFFRGDPARTHGQANHGLGLAIVGAISRMHKGRTVASSQDGVTSIGIEISPR